jgi:hypothetical protein
MMEMAEHVNGLTIRVDRLQQSLKLWRWVATTGAIFALGSALTVARMLYGMGSDGAELRADIRQGLRLGEENKADLKELRGAVYARRYGLPSAPNPPP